MNRENVEFSYLIYNTYHLFIHLVLFLLIQFSFIKMKVPYVQIFVYIIAGKRQSFTPLRRAKTEEEYAIKLFRLYFGRIFIKKIAKFQQDGFDFTN